jgi:hypothetical protein
MRRGEEPTPQERAYRSHRLRSRGLTWEEIAAVWEADFGVGPRLALRWAHNLSHQKVADRWNELACAADREPTMVKARVFQFEHWHPGKGGRRPSVANLDMLARIYQTIGRRLLSDEEYVVYDPSSREAIDRIDHRRLDTNARPDATPIPLSARTSDRQACPPVPEATNAGPFAAKPAMLPNPTEELLAKDLAEASGPGTIQDYHRPSSPDVGHRTAEGAPAALTGPSTGVGLHLNGLAGTDLFAAVVAPSAEAEDPITSIADALNEYSYPVGTDGADSGSLQSLAASVALAKTNYQTCRYGEVAAALPSLLRSVRIACTVLTGDARLRALRLSAEAHHVAASILFKHGETGLSWIAADRSLQAAHASEDPLMIGSSSRIVIHALMEAGHLRAALAVASRAAERMGTNVATSPTANDLSIYGALLLRASIAAARYGDRHSTAYFLDEAEDAGRCLGHEGNHMWTAFGPNNVLCHRVHAACALGDAGTAVEYARRVDINALAISERKAALLLDTARAFLIWGKHDKAVHVLRAAGDIAPEEVTSRPTTRTMIRNIIATGSPTVARQAREYARSLGVVA